MRPLLLALTAYAASIAGDALAAREPQRVVEQDPQSLLAELRSLSADLEYDRVVTLGRRLLLRGDLDENQRSEGLLLLGSALVIVGDAAAGDVFDELLRLRPTYELPPGTERKVTVVFNEAKTRQRSSEEARRRAYVRDMVIETPEIAKVTAGQPLIFEFAIRDPNHVVNTAALKYRLASSPEYLVLSLRAPIDGSDRWSGQIPGTVTDGQGGGELQWFLTTSDAAGQALVGVADAGTPRSVLIDKVAVVSSRPFYKTWWFWTAVGVGAVAAATTAIIVSHGSDAPADNPLPDSDLGRVDLK